MAATDTGGDRSARLTIFFCFLAAVIEGVDLQSAGVAAPGLRAAYSLDASQLSYVLTCGPLGLLIGAIIGGRLADRFGRKTVLAVSVATFGLFSLLTAWAPNYEILLVVRVLTGLGLGGATPNLIALTGEASKRATSTAAVALVFAGMPVGGALASYIGFLLGPTGDWRMIFYIGGIVPLILAPLIWMFLPESRRFKADQAAIADAGDVRPSVVSALFAENRALTSLLLWAASFFTLLILYLLLNWLPSLMIGKGFDREDAMVIQLLFNGGSVVGGIVLGRMMDKGKRALILLVVYIGMAASLFALGAAPPVLAAAAAAAVAVGFFVVGGQFVLYGLYSGFYATRIRGTGAGAATAVGRFGAIAGPLLAGALLSGGKSTTEVLMNLLPVVALGGVAAVALIFRPTVDE